MTESQAVRPHHTHQFWGISLFSHAFEGGDNIIPRVFTL